MSDQQTYVSKIQSLYDDLLIVHGLIKAVQLLGEDVFIEAGRESDACLAILSVLDDLSCQCIDTVGELDTLKWGQPHEL